MTEDSRPYIIERAGPKGRVKLTPTAREWARLYNMTDEQMAKRLLQQHSLQQSGMVQRDGEN
jgi:hypothetical protein